LPSIFIYLLILLLCDWSRISNVYADLLVFGEWVVMQVDGFVLSLSCILYWKLFLCTAA